jgi:hypothetical protein
MKYRVNALVTISIHTDVEAESEQEAYDLAYDRPMQSFCHHCAGGDPEEVWSTSGELDGEPINLAAELSEGQTRDR